MSSITIPSRSPLLPNGLHLPGRHATDDDFPVDDQRVWENSPESESEAAGDRERERGRERVGICGHKLD